MSALPRSTDDSQEPTRSRIKVKFNGLTGYIERSCIGWVYRGKWASHTGFNSEHQLDEEEASAIAYAHQLYAEQESFPYLVGEEGRDYGWKTIQLDSYSRIRVRTPVWTSVVIEQALQAVGLTLTDSINRYWSFAAGVTLEQGSEVLSPLLAPRTRFVDEAALAERLISCYQHSALFAVQNQLTLF